MSEITNIVIFGCTGYTGLCSLESAVQKGHTVTAFVRDENKLPEKYKGHERVRVVVGNVLNYDQVLAAVKDVKGVVVVLGTRNKLEATTEMSEGLKNILNAMKASGVTTISVCLSAFLFYEPEKVPPIFKEINTEHQRMYDILKDSGLQYIAVFPPHINDQTLVEFTVEHDKSPGRIISKEGLGLFLVESLNQPEHYGHVCGIANCA